MKLALIGQSLSHSYSSVLHTALGSDYQLVEVAPSDLANFVAHCPVDGYNVTVPYKQAIIPFLDGLSDKARLLGAVNTVRKEGNKWIGYNTDYAGFLGALRYYGVDVGGKNALVLGSGGASQVVQAVLGSLGAKTTVVSRKGETDYANCYRLQDSEILVNATPVGTHPQLDDAPLDVTRFGNLRFVYDLVYNPPKTRILYEACKMGVEGHNGLTMLVIQALEARKLWLGENYDQGLVEDCLAMLANKTSNIALVGMPSAGKTSVGKRLAEITDRAFVDTDGMIQQKTRVTPAEIIRNKGEEAFRDIETEVVREACCLRGTVIALGGGAILREDNRRYLNQTATVVWLQRDLDALDMTDRPTLQSAGAMAMAQARYPLYQATSDYCVVNEDIDQTAERIRQLVDTNRRSK